jgi:hypothetical protein
MPRTASIVVSLLLPMTFDASGVAGTAAADDWSLRGAIVALLTTSTSTSTTASSSTTTQSTTTTQAATTSTTLPVACMRAADFDSIACRLSVVAVEMTVSSDLGKLKQTLFARVAAARDRTEDASVACANGKLRPTKSALKHAARKVTSTVARIRSHVGRQVIPPAVASKFTGELGPVGADLKTLQKTVKCPLAG